MENKEQQVNKGPSAEVVAHSVGPNGVEIFTLLCKYWRGVHSEVLRHRNISHSVASSRAIPAAKLMEQVMERPAMPVLWPTTHKGMQGSNVEEGSGIYAMKSIWLTAKDKAVEASKEMTDCGLSKQLTNRLIEPWVECRDVMTFTRPQIEGFFRLRHPWHYGYDAGCECGYEEQGESDRGQFLEWHCPDCGKAHEATSEVVWESEVNLNFPAEYNIQKLAIEIRSAMMSSTPTVLGEGEWHLPFITEEDKCTFLEQEDAYDKLIRISGSRCAMTSYNVNKGRSLEMELDLADRLVADNHWSPFEHQAQAIRAKGDEPEDTYYWEMAEDTEGIECRFNGSKEQGFSLWSRNFQGWCQARSLMDNK